MKNASLSAICNNLNVGAHVSVCFKSSMFSMGMAIDEKTRQPVPTPVLNRLTMEFRGYDKTEGVLSASQKIGGGGNVIHHIDVEDIAVMSEISEVAIARRLVQ